VTSDKVTNGKIKTKMEKVEMNTSMKLSPHFTLGELTKTKHVTADGNIPSHVVIENLKRLCPWLEELRRRYNEPIIINSGYRSPAVNKLAGGSNTSNHLTGCAVDIRTYGMEQAMRYAVILMDYADDSNLDFDEILIEKNSKGSIWLHFAVRPKDNRRIIRLINV
jgi:uncharacterized protein YcbK (DUF882 family)